MQQREVAAFGRVDRPDNGGGNVSYSSVKEGLVIHATERKDFLVLVDKTTDNGFSLLAR